MKTQGCLGLCGASGNVPWGPDLKSRVKVWMAEPSVAQPWALSRDFSCSLVQQRKAMSRNYVQDSTLPSCLHAVMPGGSKSEYCSILKEQLSRERHMALSVTDLVPRRLLLMFPARPLLKDMPGCEEDGSICQQHKQDDDEGAQVEPGLRCARWAGRKRWARPWLG